MMLSQPLDAAQTQKLLRVFCETKYGCCKTDFAWRQPSQGNECGTDESLPQPVLAQVNKNLEVLPSPHRQAERAHGYSAHYWR